MRTGIKRVASIPTSPVAVLSFERVLNKESPTLSNSSRIRKSVDLSARMSHNTPILDSHRTPNVPFGSRSTNSITVLSPSPEPIRRKSSASTTLETCHKCNRSFSSDRICKHISVCKGSTNSSKQTTPTSTSSDQTEKKQLKKWELQSAALRAQMRANRGLAPDPNAPELPPPEDLVTCPHCSRKFSQQASERHVAICAKVISRPLPPSKNVSRISSDPVFSSRSSLLKFANTSPSASINVKSSVSFESKSSPQRMSSAPLRKSYTESPKMNVKSVSAVEERGEGKREACFCVECGQRFSISNAKFCPFCGTRRHFE
ncbi:hypothetical protein RCL1_006450 [Eukaryota sp. TZLM3-RCL]